MTENYFTEKLLLWYWENKRILPWRDRQNAYFTWVSEIMLQQTRVEAVKPYFESFMRELPDVKALADCPEDKLLKLWEGLGYYSRVRNLQKAAKRVTEEYGGKIPEDFEELLKLPGIGRYTAGAISSIAYGHKAPAVDGNVLRVMTRVLEDSGDISKEAVRKRMENQVLERMPEDHAGDFNQALMELGATVCVPNGAPACDRCPIHPLCQAALHGTQMSFPVKPAKKARRLENRTVLVIQDEGGRVVLHRRPNRGLLAGLFEFPNVEGTLSSEEAIQFVTELGMEPLWIEPLPNAKHIFSHIEWRMQAYRIRVAKIPEWKDSCLVVSDQRKDGDSYAIPSAFDTYVQLI